MVITNIFSIFDPTTQYLPTAWLMLIFPISLATPPLWGVEGVLPNTTNKVISIINKEVVYSLNTTQNSVEPIIVSVFVIIGVANILALYPHIFSVTSHLTVTLPISLLFWLSLSLFAWTSNTNHMLTHLLPQSTPPALITFMVSIELVSNLIRPITLCVRLTANLIAGHLLISLLGNFIIGIPTSLALPLTFLPLALTVLETAVACIQAYVFVTLVTLYITETK